MMMAGSGSTREVDDHVRLTQERWDKETNREITMVITRRSGTGKSTLTKNILDLSGEEGPKVEHSPKLAVTIQIKIYEAKIRGVMVRIIDVPGLDEKREKELLKELEGATGKKADILLYCVPLLPSSRIDITDKRIILMLTKAFGESLWKKAILVLTFANVANSISSQPMSELVRIYAEAFQEMMHSAKLTSFTVEPSLTPDKAHDRDATTIAALPAGKCRDEVIIEGARWDDNIYLEALKKCEYEAIPALLCLKGISLNKLHTALASLGGLGTSAVVGAGIGALIEAAGFGIGAIPGAVIGGAVGAGASTMATTAVLGTMAGNIVAKRIQENELN